MQVDEFICYKQPAFALDWFEFNYTSNSDFVELLRNISLENQKPWFEKHSAKWNLIDRPPFTEQLLHPGIGYTFNLIDAKEVVNVER